MRKSLHGLIVYIRKCGHNSLSLTKRIRKKLLIGSLSPYINSTNLEPVIIKINDYSIGIGIKRVLKTDGVDSYCCLQIETGSVKIHAILPDITEEELRVLSLRFSDLIESVGSIDS